MAEKCGYGKIVQRQMENVHEIYRSQQGLSKRCLSSTKYRLLSQWGG